MQPKVEKREALKPLPRLLNVAAYARVSSLKDEMKHSLSAQVSYYSGMIQSHPGWIYAGVFYDEGVTGTKELRKGFQDLLTKCREGKIDMVITKSISRFARNTVTLLSTVRELKSIGVDVFFEEQDIHSSSASGELMLTILASFAQEESLSVSTNQKWKIKKCFEEGKPWNVVLYGYRWKDGCFRIEPAEAAVVRRIFADYLSGMGTPAIAKEFNRDGIKTLRSYPCKPDVVAKVLRNYTYTGNLHLQKTYRENHLTKRKMKNDGVLPCYLAEETHEAIIDVDTFNAVQEEIRIRAEKYKHSKPCDARYPFSGMIVCGKCGRHYRRKTTQTGIVWICSTYNTQGKAACPSKQIPEEKLAGLLSDLDNSDVQELVAEGENTIRIRFKEGGEELRTWQDRSRSESWTDEKRASARKKRLERSDMNG